MNTVSVLAFLPNTFNIASRGLFTTGTFKTYMWIQLQQLHQFIVCKICCLAIFSRLIERIDVVRARGEDTNQSWLEWRGQNFSSHMKAWLFRFQAKNQTHSGLDFLVWMVHGWKVYQHLGFVSSCVKPESFQWNQHMDSVCLNNLSVCTQYL